MPENLLPFAHFVRTRRIDLASLDDSSLAGVLGEFAEIDQAREEELTELGESIGTTPDRLEDPEQMEEFSDRTQEIHERYRAREDELVGRVRLPEAEPAPDGEE